MDFSFETYYHSPKTYAAIFNKVGFVDFKWIAFEVSDEAPDKKSFDDLLAKPFTTAFSAVKPF